jgi:phospholipid/cholesterol/gamma-HCH transport system substrate-binding protein
MRMDRDVNYVAVGAFVLLVVAMAVSFVFWYTDQQDKRTYQRYEIYFEGSVSGLTAGSPVRYLGVDVGKVKRIQLDPQQRKRVMVVVDIDSTAPIDNRTLALLSLQGVTGLLFIDLEQDKEARVAGALPQGLNYPIIRSAPSDLEMLLSSLPNLANHIIELVGHFNQLFSDENIRAFNATLDNARRASESLPETLRDAQQLVADMRAASHDVQLAADDIHEIATDSAPALKRALENVDQITERLASTANRLDSFVAANEPGLSHFTAQGLPELEQLLRESRDAARDFRDLSRSLKQNPSQLIYESTYRGVEVPR